MKTLIRKGIRDLLRKFLPITGRTNTGQLALYHRGGGISLKYRLVDFKHLIWKMASLVLYNEYDPKRTSFISLVCFNNGILSYILTVDGLFSGDVVYSSSLPIVAKFGNFIPLNYIPEGSKISQIEFNIKKGSSFVRSAGTTAFLVRKFFKLKKILVRLPSKEEILINQRKMAVIGQISNLDHKMEIIKKAGFSVLKGFRPNVRGVAKNPVDHPHGGGGGRCLVTKWAKPAKNYPTRKKKIFLILI